MTETTQEQMTEITQEQLHTINLRSADILKDLLRRIAESEDQQTETLEIIAEAYGRMVALSILGFDVEGIASDSRSGATRLADLLEEIEDDITTSD